MSITLSDIEQRIENLIEVHLIKLLPGSIWQDRIAYRLTEALKANLATNGLDNPLNHNFTLVVNPSLLAQWQKDPRLMDGLTKIFRLATGEAGVQFSIAPTISLASDERVPVDDIEVRVDGKNIAETQNTATSPGNADESQPALRTAFLIVGGTKVFTLDQMVVNIGRRLDNQVVIDDPRVSRYHAQIRYVRGKFVIFDLNSTGGTYVNGQRTSQSVLYPGDVISLAGLPVIFGQDNPPQGLSGGDTAPISTHASERSTATLKTIPLNDKNDHPDK
jgi:hypothetical protein